MKILKSNSENITLEGICTHFAGAESLENFGRIIDQIKTYKQKERWFQDRGLQPVYRHMACSAGVLNFPDSSMDLVRVGISNYGFWPSNETKMLHFENGTTPIDPLRQVLIGKQGDKEISVSSFSDMNNSMNYELLTRLPRDIPRYEVE